MTSQCSVSIRLWGVITGKEAKKHQFKKVKTPVGARL